MFYRDKFFADFRKFVTLIEIFGNTSSYGKEKDRPGGRRQLG